ncbi:MAG: hypothetical protein IPJ86_10510 [Bacteroidetes bacterium]|nr:hypothetical protein [Bacteroidota bacterium]
MLTKNMYLEIKHAFAKNNYALPRFLEGNFALADVIIKLAIKATKERALSILKITEELIRK